MVVALLSTISCNRESVFDDEFDPRLNKETSTLWDFLSSSNYSFNTNYVEISGGAARLKTVDQLFSGTDFNSGTHVGTYYDSSSQRVKMIDKTNSSLDVRTILSSKSSNLVGYWRFEGNFNDSSNSSFDAPSFGDTVLSSTSKVGGTSSGSNGAGGANATGFSLSGSVTASGWVLRESDTTAYWQIFSNEDFASGVGLYLGDTLAGTNDPICFRINGTTGNAHQACEDNISLNVWTHYIGVFDGDKVYLYKNGTLENQADPSFTSMINDTGGVIGNNLNGNVDEVAIWNTAISSTEALKLYNVQSGDFTSLSSTWTPKYSNIVGYWKMDGNWQDSSGNGNNLTAEGDITSSAASQVGSQSALLDGAGDCSSQSAINLGNTFSISSWFKSSASPQSTKWQAILGIGSSGGTDDGIRFTLHNYNNEDFSIRFATGNGSSFDGASTNTNVFSHDRWNHLIATINRSAGEAKIYLNGIEVTIDTSILTDFANSGTIRLGSTGDSCSSGNFNGNIDDFAIWTKILTEENVITIYNRQKQKYAGHYDSPVIDLGSSSSWTNLDTVTSLPFGKEIVAQTSESSSDYSALSGDLSNALIGYWPLNEPSTNSVGGYDFEDYSSNNNHCDLLAGSLSAPGVINNAVDSANINCSSALFPFSNRSFFSVSAWFKTSLTGAGLFFDIFRHRSSDGDGVQGWTCYINGSSNALSCRRTVDSAETGSISTNGMNDGEWHHVTMTYDGADIRTYLDGEHISTNADTRNMKDIGANFRIGDSGADAGQVDEVAIWSRVLTSTEIQQLYRRGANRIKYQVKSCVDSSCNCKSFNTSPVGSMNDCDGDGIANDSDTSDTYLSDWVGNNGAGTYLSELQNCASLDANGDCDGDVRADSMILNFTDFPVASQPANNRYFQYRVHMEAEENTACSGSACLPELTSVEVGPTGRYYGGSPVIKPNSGLTYSDLKEITFTESGSCSLTYQLSPDGSTYYYHNGTAWISASAESVSESTSSTNIQSNITSFKGSAGAGSLYFKAFMTSDTSQSCSLDDISIKVPN
jgi:hypothetical protein